MITKTILQIPLSKSLKIEAEKASEDLGFSSLQETVRIFIKKLADRAIDMTIATKEKDQLSKTAIVRYAKMTEEMRKGKNVYYAKDVDDFIKQMKSA